MAQNKYVLAGEGAIWVQPDGPNTQPKYLGCHELGDIDEPLGDVKLLYCPGENPNEFLVTGSYQTAPGAITTSITTDLQKVVDYLEQTKCPFGVYLLHIGCGKKSTFLNYDRAFVMERTWVTKRGISKFAVKDPDNQDKTQQSFDISAEAMLRILEMKTTRLEIAETESLNSITSCDSDVCEGSCGIGHSKGDNLYVVGGVLAGSAGNTADMEKSTDGGSNWAPGASDPFAATETIASIKCFPIDSNTTRIIVARGTTDAGNPAEIAFSDDGGLTWTYVDVGTTNGQYALGEKSLFVMDSYNIWLCTSGGYIYHSADQGATWTAETSGTLSVQNLHAIEFYGSDYGFACGANGLIVKTIDGGGSWSLVTGPVSEAAVIANTLSVLSDVRVWVGYNDGKLFYTMDGGSTWYERAFTGSGAGAVKSMDWYDVYTGIIAHNTATPNGYLLMTIDGGYSWKRLPYVTNSGLNSVIMISPTLAYAVGAANGGTAVVLKAFGQ